MISRNGDWIDSSTPEESVMINLDTGKYLGLNAVGSRIWEILECPTSQERICEIIIDEFDVQPEECRETIRRFLVRMEDVGAVKTPPLDSR